MLNLLAINLTAAAMLVHALVGCCWHALGTADSSHAEAVVTAQDSCCNQPAAPHEPVPGTPHEPGCQETVGSYVSVPEVDAPDLAVNLLALPTPILTASVPPVGFVTVNFSLPAPAPTRLYLALEVLRI